MYSADKRPGWGVILVCLAALFLFCTAIASAAEEGDGSGGGQAAPLGLTTSDPADGQRGVRTLVAIKLIFNKNVVNMTVKDNNLKCFSLYSLDGGRVPIEVVMADDQVQPEKKREVTLRPLRELLPGKTYTVKVAPGLKAKNGTAMGKEASFSFSTAGDGGDKTGADTDRQVQVGDTSAENTPTGETLKTPTVDDKTDKSAGTKNTDDGRGASAADGRKAGAVTEAPAAADGLPSAPEEAPSLRISIWVWLALALSAVAIYGSIKKRNRR